jgi:hypothetical protein
MSAVPEYWRRTYHRHPARPPINRTRFAVLFALSLVSGVLTLSGAMLIGLGLAGVGYLTLATGLVLAVCVAQVDV